MDLSSVFLVLYESAFVLGVFLLSLLFVIFIGRQQMVNLIFGLYFGLLFTYTAPFSDNADLGNLWLSIAIFLAATTGATVVTGKLMPEPFREKKFESLGKKLFLACAATILVVLFSFHVIPVQDIVNISSPVRSLFASEAAFFWWLVTPFVLLYFHK